MHILYICQYFPPEMGAPAARAYEFSRRWVEAGHRVTVVCGIPNHPTGEVYPGYRKQWRKTETIDGIDVHRMWVHVTANAGTLRRTLNYLSFGLTAVLGSLRVRKADVCIASTPQFFAGLAGTVVRRLKRIPLVLEVRDLWPDSLAAVEAPAGKGMMSLLRRIERFMYRSARRIVVVSPAFRPHIERTGIPAERIDTVPNGVNTALFHPRSTMRDAPPTEMAAAEGSSGIGGNAETDAHDGTDWRPARRHFAEHGDAFLAGYIGTHGMAHGLETLLDAARMLESENMHVVFVGEGARKRELKALARDIPNVTFYDRRPREVIAEMYAELDAALVLLRDTPLFRTVIPSKMFEIMGTGVPIVLGVEGQARTILDEAQGGIGIPPGDARALADALLRLRDDAAFRREAGKNAFHYVRNHYDIDALAQRYLTTLQNACAGR